jgi:hypothetical protein
MEIFNVVKEILTLIIAGAGVIIAGMALYTWRKEFIGKKKIDLACDIVEQACNMQDLIFYIRSKYCYPREAKEAIEILKKDNNTIKEENIYRLIASYRVYEKKEEINKFIKLRNKAQLYWDRNILDLFQELKTVIFFIRDSSYNYYSKDVLSKEETEYYNGIIFYLGDKNDKIANKVQKIVDEFKLNLEPLYKDRLTKWKKLK